MDWIRCNIKEKLSINLKTPINMEKNYWWIISLSKDNFVGGEGPDDEIYPCKTNEILKFLGPNNITTFKNVFAAIVGKNEKVDFVWCLGNKEELVFAEELHEYLKSRT